MITARLKAARFQTKVLVPVVAVMVLLVTVTVYVVNSRITRQLQNEATQALAAADGAFRNFQQIRGRSLRARFNNIANEPKYRAACQLNDPDTLRPLLAELLGPELGGDLIQFKPADTNLVTVAPRDTPLNMGEFARNSAPSVNEALDGFANADIIRVGAELFDVVSVPVRTPAGDAIIGVLTFCLRLGEAEVQELSKMTGSGVVLLANDRVAGASLEHADLFQQCVSLFGSVRNESRRAAMGTPVHEIVIPQEHFRVWVGTFDSKSGDPRLGYVLLYSYEQALRELRATQQTIVAVSIVAILFGTVVIWLLIRNVTRPLRDLRESAEAVGRGDFTRRVPVTSTDECGELARVFNQMTENVQASRQQLEEMVSRLKSTQAQLVQSEKLSAIGEFVAGVTHELNNPLTSVLGFSELLQQTSVDERQRRFTERIAQSARRCQKIVQSLLSFARQHQPERKAMDVNGLLESVVEIMAYEMRTSNIEVVTQFDRALPRVLVDGHQVQQVFLNIINNARQAIEATQRPGRLRIRSEAIGERVRILFTDNGPGIPEANLKRIFDPFFTTKEAGKGTGLGLSLSYGIIREHGGTIRVESRPGAGATFIVELPAHRAETGAAEKSVDGAERGEAPRGEGKRVLVVDDEEGILDFISEVLASDGYTVDTASDGEAAMERLRREQYDLTLCDWKMPGVNGRQLYERIQTEDREAAERFIFMTGDVISGHTQDFFRRHRKGCLAKPFSIAEFRSAVATLVDFN